MTPITCACTACQAMCASSTCLPTPDEARALIRAGLGPRLASFRFAPDPQRYAAVGPAPMGREGERDLPHTLAACTFFDGQDCELHSKGLKPLEGRLAHHDRNWYAIRLHVLEHWKGRALDSVLATLKNSPAADAASNSKDYP